MFKTLVLTVLFHACGTWSEVKPKSLAQLKRAYLGMCRAMLTKHVKTDVLHLGEDRVLALLHLPSVAVWMHFFRLSYLCSFVALGVEQMWALAHAEGSWLRLVRSSLEWLWEQIDRGTVHASWDSAWGAWYEDMVCRPKIWKRRIRFAAESATRAELLHDSWQFSRGCVLRFLIKAGGQVQQWVDDVRQGRYACGPCQRTFSTKQAWAVHAFKTHGRVRFCRKLVDGQQCPICLKHFPSCVQLCQHVEYSVHCMRQLVAQGFTGVIQPGIGNKRASVGLDFLGVARQGLGPSLPDVAVDSHLPSSLRATRAWQALEAFLQADAGHDTWTQLLEKYRRALCAECLDTTGLLGLAQEWLVHIEAQDEISIAAAALHRAVSFWIVESFSVEWLCSQPLAVEAPLATYRHSVQGLAMLEFGPAFTVPRPAVSKFNAGLVCLEQCLGAFSSFGSFVKVFDLDWCLHHPAWVQQMEECATSVPHGLLVLCLAGFPIQSMLPPLPIRAKAFAAHLRCAKVWQAAVDLVLRWWSQERPIAAILPRLDEAVLSALKQLPGLLWTQGSAHCILHTVAEDSIPDCLFHLCS